MIVSSIRNKIKNISLVIAFLAMMVAPVLAPLPVMAQGTDSVQVKQNDCQVPYAQLNSSNCGIVKYIVLLTNILSLLVGVVIVISLVWGGIQYTMAKADPQGVAAARHRISNAILALFMYIFMFAFLQWVVPGGVF
jgi:hypothetical protein